MIGCGRIFLFVIIAHIIGALTSIRAILDVRTSQGAIAWAISLNTFPYAAVAAFWIFGRSNFEGEVLLRQENHRDMSERQQELSRSFIPFRPAGTAEPLHAALLERLAMLPVTHGIHAELLIDGQATFDSIFQGIAAAREYVLVQFYIIHDDGLGRRADPVRPAAPRSRRRGGRRGRPRHR